MWKLWRTQAYWKGLEGLGERKLVGFEWTVIVFLWGKCGRWEIEKFRGKIGGNLLRIVGDLIEVWSKVVEV